MLEIVCLLFDTSTMGGTISPSVPVSYCNRLTPNLHPELSFLAVTSKNDNSGWRLVDAVEHGYLERPLQVDQRSVRSPGRREVAISNPSQRQTKGVKKCPGPGITTVTQYSVLKSQMFKTFHSSV